MTDYKIPHKLQTLHEDIRPDELRWHTHRVAVSKEFTFDAAHHLHLYEGKCRNLHGHTYRLVVTVSGVPNDTGFVLDFSEMKRIFKQLIESKLDHQYLNESLPPMNTTAENIISWIWTEWSRELEHLARSSPGLRLERLDLWETPTSRATLVRAWMSEEGGEFR